MVDASAKRRFWDNLIPLRGSLFGEQLAGWTPGPPVMSGLGCTMLSDQPVPVADNVSLAADIYLPQRPGRYPAVVVFSAYSKELQTAGAPTGTNETGSPPVFTDRGYVHIIVARRGMGRSQGNTGVFFNDDDVDDHERVIAWAAEQPWCDGNVVLFGTSYYGMVQPQVAVRRPPALKAFFSNEMCTDYFRHIVQFGGAPALYFVSLLCRHEAWTRGWEGRVSPSVDGGHEPRAATDRSNPQYRLRDRHRHGGAGAADTR